MSRFLQNHSIKSQHTKQSPGNKDISSATTIQFLGLAFFKAAPQSNLVVRLDSIVETRKDILFALITFSLERNGKQGREMQRFAPKFHFSNHSLHLLLIQTVRRENTIIYLLCSASKATKKYPLRSITTTGACRFTVSICLFWCLQRIDARKF